MVGALLKKYWFPVLFLLAVLARFYRITAPLEEPHSWRQADTANYALDLYRHGFNLFKPMVCWLGDHATLILEFPLYESIVALFYFLVGEQLIIARFFSICFWAGSAVYLYRLVALLYDSKLAQLTTFIYSILPLGLYYSRAVHIDFCALFFAHAMAFYVVEGKSFWKGAIAGALGAMIKVPYVFPLYFPLVLYYRRRYKPLLFAFGIFLIWQFYVNKINASAPDWFFIPGYFKFVNLWNWYFGPFAERLHPENWYFLWQRILYEVTTPYGMILVLGGLAVQFKERQKFFLVWLLGIFCYVLVFFHLSVTHDYYLIPFLPVVSFLIASLIKLLTELKFPRSQALRFSVAVLVLICLTVSSWVLARIYYYHVDWLRYEAGAIIHGLTGERDLVIASAPDADPRDPRILYAARRHGFSIAERDLNPELVQKLTQLHAKYVAIVRISGEETFHLGEIHLEKFNVMHAGKRVGTLYLGRL